MPDPAGGSVRPADAARVPAMGGTRTVPAPDAVARDYLLLALRLDQHIPGLVDGYFGPADLKAQVDMEQGRSPARLRDDAADLRERLAAEVAEDDRRAWLDAQLVALETQAAALAGEPLPYLDHVARCFAYPAAPPPGRRVRRRGRGHRRAAPRRRALTDRLDAWDRRFEIATDRLPRGPRLAGGAVPGACRDDVRAARRRGPAGVPRPRPAVVRLQLVRRRPPLAGRHQHGPARPRRRARSTRSPTRRTRATTSSTRGRRRTWSTASAASRHRSC